MGAPAGRNGLWNWDLAGTSQPLPSVENTFYSGIGHLHAQENTSSLQLQNSVAESECIVTMDC